MKFFWNRKKKGNTEKLALLEEKIQALEIAEIKETDAAVLFKLKKNIEEAKRKKRELLQADSQKYGLDAAYDDEFLKSAIRELEISTPIGPLHCVNCNRREMMGRFWDSYTQFLEDRYQFYFISACPKQMPHSFSERSLLELLIKEFEEDLNSIWLPRKPGNGRLELSPLPTGWTLVQCQKAFRKFFSTHLKPKEGLTMETFLQQGLPGLHHKYVAQVFYIHERQWGKAFTDYFQWIIDSFSQVPPNATRFLFFFVVYMDDLHQQRRISSDRKKILDTLHQLSGKNKSTVHFSPPHPVPAADLDAWLVNLGVLRPAKREIVIQTFIQGLHPEDQKNYHQSKNKLLNMNDIERLQNMVFEVFNE